MAAPIHRNPTGPKSIVLLITSPVAALITSVVLLSMSTLTKGFQLTSMRMRNLLAKG